MMNHPSKIIIPVPVALADWTGPGHYEVKLDGKFAIREVSGGILAGEDVRGAFTAFDCLTADGQDVRSLPLVARLRLRDGLCTAHGIKTVPSVSTDGAALLQRVLSAGGEGVVLKSPGSYWEPMLAAKRSIIVTCRVTAIGPGQSIALADDVGDVGKCPAKGGAADRVRVGSLVRIEAACFTAGRKLREPKLCREWLYKF
jgi:hypothetical protein